MIPEQRQKFPIKTSEPRQTKRFTKIGTGFQLLTIFAKCSIWSISGVFINFWRYFGVLIINFKQILHRFWQILNYCF